MPPGYPAGSILIDPAPFREWAERRMELIGGRDALLADIGWLGTIARVVEATPYSLETGRDGNPAPFEQSGALKLERQMARAQRRGTQRAASTGAGHARERDAARRHPDGHWQDERAGGGGGAMHAGRYDLSPTANRRFQSWTQAWATEALRVLKPGGHLVSFSSTRTYHRMVVGIEDAGFEIRDQLCWLFGSGFPKSKNLDGDWKGWGTALKPGHEPIVLARKPFATTVTANVLAHGTGAINIEGSRVGDAGRWPSNVLLDEEVAALLDDQSPYTSRNPTRRNSDKFADVGGASRFYYCAKASRRERDAGLLGEPQPKPTWSSGELNAGSFQSPGTETHARNVHPTVKPVDLMRWLVQLVAPAGAVVLDPFLGSGTTGCAVVAAVHDDPNLAWSFVGIDRDPSYVALANARIRRWGEHGLEAASVRAESAGPGQQELFA